MNESNEDFGDKLTKLLNGYHEHLKSIGNLDLDFVDPMTQKLEIFNIGDDFDPNKALIRAEDLVDGKGLLVGEKFMASLAHVKNNNEFLLVEVQETGKKSYEINDMGKTLSDFKERGYDPTSQDVDRRINAAVARHGIARDPNGILRVNTGKKRFPQSLYELVGTILYLDGKFPYEPCDDGFGRKDVKWDWVNIPRKDKTFGPVMVDVYEIDVPFAPQTPRFYHCRGKFWGCVTEKVNTDKSEWLKLLEESMDELIEIANDMKDLVNGAEDGKMLR